MENFFLNGVHVKSLTEKNARRAGLNCVR